MHWAGDLSHEGNETGKIATTQCRRIAKPQTNPKLLQISCQINPNRFETQNPDVPILLRKGSK